MVTVPAGAADETSATITATASDGGGAKGSSTVTVEATTIALVFVDVAAFDIPASTIGTAIANIDIATGVSGGKTPYTFSATGLPAGVVISAAGLISGTPTTAAEAGTATVSVKDSSSPAQEKSITIAFGAVTATDPVFVAVTDIAGVPTTMTAGTPLALTGTVSPTNATNQTIVWSVKSAGTTGATISSNTLNTTTAGTVIVTATIAGGTTMATAYTKEFTITVNATATAPVIKSHPVDVTVTEGERASFRVTADKAESYQWQVYLDDGGRGRWVDLQEVRDRISGTTTAILTLYDAAVESDGIRVRCVVTNVAGSTTSDAATLTVTEQKPDAPAITEHPESRSVEAGERASFRVTADKAESYQWQVYLDDSGRGRWVDLQDVRGRISGTTTATLALSDVAVESDGLRVRCVVTNAGGSTTSDEATLRVTGKRPATPVITVQPEDQTVPARGMPTFSIEATGATSYQWQISYDGGATWTDMRNMTTNILMLEDIDSRESGSMYRCMATNAAGSTVSDTATLTVTVTPVITSNFSSKMVNIGGTVTFAITATGATSYQWQFYDNNTRRWINLINIKGIVSGATTNTLTLSNVKVSMDGLYRCVASNASGSTNSDSASLAVWQE
jgi:hypothetical protein